MTRRIPNLDRSVDILVNTASEPVINSSNFYILYYLTNVKGYDDLQIEFERLSSELREAYTVYGHYAITRELTNYSIFYPRAPQDMIDDANEGLDGTVRMLNGDRVSYREIVEYTSSTVKEVAQRIAEFNGLPNGAEELLELMYVIPTENPTGAARHSRSDVRKMMEIPDRRGLYDDSDRFFRLAEEIFELDGAWPQQGSGSWGGGNWASAARFMQKDLPDVSWVDQNFAIQHNAGVWIDKLRMTEDEEDIVDSIDPKEKSPSPMMVLDSDDGELEEYTGGYTSMGTKQKHIINDVLDSARGGDMDYVFRVARESGRIRDLNRYRHLF